MKIFERYCQLWGQTASGASIHQASRPPILLRPSTRRSLTWARGRSKKNVRNRARMIWILTHSWETIVVISGFRNPGPTPDVITFYWYRRVWWRLEQIWVLLSFRKVVKSYDHQDSMVVLGFKLQHLCDKIMWGESWDVVVGYRFGRREK